ncbi:YdcF family protein [Methylobacterium nonmethylotrophicum]|uniref:YdcF family protein n=1 Tax=Methylobacterium nonmethylotrophicum TaxID=1141884 RepID=A0A4Z0NVK9_9HYPH|nr:YdcF family protein [Methylobacterium nonmethylotrophicum]TGE01187.1 YdcF family protein [Methylobacterium nonmethylotrophicum]
MFFVLSKVLWFLTAPSNLLLLLVLAGAGLGLRWQRLGLGLCAAGAFVLLVGGISPLAGLLFAPLENRFPRFRDDGTPVAGIVVLGGGVETGLSAARGQLVLNDAGERMVALGDLARRYPQATLVFAGGSGRLTGDGAVSEAAVLRRHAASLGVAPERITYEDRSRNTRENAAFSAALVKPKPGERWLLVTSAWHMPRAIGCFRQAGFTVTAYPVDYRTAPRLLAFHATVGDGLFDFDIASREWLGLVAYRASGYTETVFPGP